MRKRFKMKGKQQFKILEEQNHKQNQGFLSFVPCSGRTPLRNGIGPFVKSSAVSERIIGTTGTKASLSQSKSSDLEGKMEENLLD